MRWLDRLQPRRDHELFPKDAVVNLMLSAARHASFWLMKSGKVAGETNLGGLYSVIADQIDGVIPPVTSRSMNRWKG